MTCYNIQPSNFLTDERRLALSQWSGVALADITQPEDDSYEFHTPTAVYWVLDKSEADDMASETAEQVWHRESSRLSYSPALLRAAEQDFYAIASRGSLLSVDRREHIHGEWFIYYQGEMSHPYHDAWRGARK